MGILERTYIKGVDNEDYKIRKPKKEIPMLRSAVELPKTAERTRELTEREKEDEFIREYNSIPDYNVFERAANLAGNAITNLVNLDSGGRGKNTYTDEYAKKSKMTDEYNRIINKRAQEAMDAYQSEGGTGLPVLAGVNASQMFNKKEYQKAQEEIVPYLRKQGVTFEQFEDLMRAQALQEQNRNMAEYAKEHPALATGASFVTNQISGLEGAVNAANNYLSGTPLNSNQAMQEYAKLTPTIRGEVRENIKNGNYSDNSNVNKFLQNAGATAYDVATGIGDMGMSLALGGGNQAASLALMSTGAGANTLNEQMDKDTDPWQKMATAVASGAIEALTEKLPLDNLFKFANTKAGKNTVKQVIMNVLKQTVTEAGEEAVSEVANNIVDRIINGDQSNYEQNIHGYMDQGMSKDDATKQAVFDVLKDTGYSALVGGLSGGVMAAGSSMMGNVKYDVNKAISDLAKEQNPDVKLDESNMSEQVHTAENGDAKNLSDEEMRAELDKHFEDVDSALDKLMKSRPTRYKGVSLGKFGDGLPDYISKSTIGDLKFNYIDEFNKAVKEHGDGFEGIEPELIIRVRYKDGSYLSTQDMNFDSSKRIPTKNIDSIIIEGEWGTDFAGNNVQLYNQREEVGDGKWGYSSLQTRYNDFDDIRADFTSSDTSYKFYDTLNKVNARKEHEKSLREQDKLLKQQFAPIVEATEEVQTSQAPSGIDPQNVINQANTDIEGVLQKQEQQQSAPEEKPQNNANELPQIPDLTPFLEFGEQKSADEEEWSRIFAEAKEEMKAQNQTIPELTNAPQQNVNQPIGQTQPTQNPHPTTTNLTRGYLDPIDEDARYEDGTRPNFKDGKKLSKVADNTLRNADYMQDPTAQDYLQKGIERGDYNYKEISELDSIANAQEMINKLGDRFKDHVRRSKEISGVMVDACMLKAKEAWEKGDYDDWRFYTRRARQTGTPAAQAVQAFAKYRDDISSVVAKANNLIENGLDSVYKSPRMKKSRETCGKLSKILYNMESDNLQETRPKAPEKTHDQIRQGVENVVRKRDYMDGFTANDIDYLTDLVENGSTEGEIRARIEARLRDNTWELPEGVNVEDTRDNGRNSVVARALKNIGNDYTQQQVKPKESFEEIKAGIKSEFNREAGSLFNDLTEEDFDYLANLIENGATADDIQFKLEQKLATGSWDISMDDIKRANVLLEEARQYDNESKIGAEKELEAYAILAEYLPNTNFKEKFDAWRYLAMLGNPRTHIRNMLGNLVFGQVMENTSDKIATIIEGAGQKMGIPELQERTKSFRIVPAEMKNRARQYAEDAKWKSLTSGGQKYTDLNRSIKSQQKVFGDKNVASKGLQKASDFVSGALTWEDNIALKQKFGQAMAGYLYENGKDVSIFDSTDAQDQALLERAADYAVRRAKEATFHEDSAFAQGWARARNYIRNSDSTGLKVAGVLMDATMPFVKTPANILNQAKKYTTPIEIIKDLRKSANPVKTIEDISKFATGSMMMILGAVLKSHGMLRTRGEEEEKQLDKLTGQQDFSINVNGKSYTLDWMAPASVPLFTGAEIYRQFVEKKNFDPVRVASAIADPITEMSMLQGLNDALDTIAGYKKNEEMSTMGNLVADLAGGYVSQAIPTVMGQIARSVDDTRRDTYYTGEKTGTDSKMEQFGKSIVSRVPVLSQMLQPKVDAWGDEMKNTGSNVASRMFWNMISPGFAADTSKTPLEEELYRLNKETDEAKNVLPEIAKNAPYNKQGKLSEEDYTNWAKLSGNNERDFEAALIENPAYANMSDSEKVAIMGDVKSFANALSKEEFKDQASKEYTYDIDAGEYKKQNEAYEYKGADGLFDYIRARYEVKKLCNSEDRGESKADRINTLNSMNDLSDEDKIAYLKIMDKYTKRGQYIDQFISPKYAYDWYEVEANAGSKKSDKIYYIMKMDISDLEKKVLIGTMDLKDSDITYHLYTGK